MTYSASESSRERGRPIELYTFNLGATRFTFTTEERERTVASILYLPEAISRGATKTIARASDAKLEVRCPSTNAFARIFVRGMPGESPTMSIKQMHLTDATVQLIEIFSGTVATVGYSKNFRESAIMCVSDIGRETQEVPRLGYQSNCGVFLYEPLCGITELSRQETGLTVGSVSGRNVTVTGMLANVNTPGTALNSGSDYFVAGFIEFGSERRLIMRQSSATFTLDLPFLEDPTGSLVRVLPGCKLRLIEDCGIKYDNAINFQGAPHVPTRNPLIVGIDR